MNSKGECLLCYVTIYEDTCKHVLSDHNIRFRSDSEPFSTSEKIRLQIRIRIRVISAPHPTKKDG